MFQFLSQPWAWYVAGPLIGLTVPLLLILGNKPFGISSTLQHICAACVPSKLPYFNYDWKAYSWNLVFVLGVFLGGVVGAFVLKNPESVVVESSTLMDLAKVGFYPNGQLMPDIFSWEGLFTVRGLILIVVGGFFVGFGTRYGNGCTSGHAINGLSHLQWSSLVATISFFAGGLFTVHVLYPILF